MTSYNYLLNNGVLYCLISCALSPFCLQGALPVYYHLCRKSKYTLTKYSIHCWLSITYQRIGPLIAVHVYTHYCKPVCEYTMFCKIIRCNIMVPDLLFHKPTRLAPLFIMQTFLCCTEGVLLLYWTHSVCQMCTQDCCSTHFASSSTKMYHSFLNIGKMWVVRGWGGGLRYEHVPRYSLVVYRTSGVTHIHWKQSCGCISSVHDESGPLLMVTVWESLFWPSKSISLGICPFQVHVLIWVL